MGTRLFRATGLASTWVLVAAIGAGCVGSIGGDSAGGDPTHDAGPASDEERAVASTRFARLSHAQWENATRDLLYLAAPSGLSKSFTSDPPGGDFDNDATLMQVTPGLWSDYQRADEALALSVTADPSNLARLMPANAPSDPDARATAFVKAFVTRAFRRPLTDAEVTAMTALYKSGVALFGGTDATAAGVRAVVQAALQSPNFIFRIEASSEVKGGVIPLSGYEIASKLSFTLWNTMPDDALFAAAASGALATADAVAERARAMLDDPRAEPAVRSFHDQLFSVRRYASLVKDPMTFPQYSPSLGAAMQEESARFVRDVVFGGKGNLKTLLTAPYTFVDARLAPLYGLTGSFTSEFRKVDLDPTKRAGILTQIGFLAMNAGQIDNDPIHRGVFVNRRILCANLPPPPLGTIPPLPPPMGQATLRHRVEAHTGKGTCGASCHATMINPIGFAYEEFDALGMLRATDNGLPLDTTGTYSFDGTPQSYDGAVDLAAKIAASTQTHQCYTRQLLEYAFGRTFTDADMPLINRITKASAAGSAIKELVVQLVTARAFLNRSTEAGK